MIAPAIDTLSAVPAPVQTPFDVAVVIPTVLRPTLSRAIDSIYAQTFRGTVQVLLGVDKVDGDVAVLSDIARRCPDHCALTLFDPGYSTSVRHGGLHPAKDGGCLRTVLSYIANSRYVAYLDDDNWWHEDHLGSLLHAVAGHDWAFSLRWYVDHATDRPLCVDEWESVGPDDGCFKGRFGGFVDTNCLMIDKLACEPALRWWSIPLHGDPIGMSGDRHVFHFLKNHKKWNGTGLATSYYVIQPRDAMHSLRVQWIEEKLGSRPQVLVPASSNGGR
jgi:hypothetical protein